MTIRQGMAPSDVICALENAKGEINNGNQYYIRITEEEADVIIGLLRTSEDALWGDKTTPIMNNALKDNFKLPDWELAKKLFEAGQTLERENARLRSVCPYCSSDNNAIRDTYYDQNCLGCIKHKGTIAR